MKDASEKVLAIMCWLAVILFIGVIILSWRINP